MVIEGYRPLDHEPEFDPARHLALALPEQVWELTDFGYYNVMTRDVIGDNEIKRVIVHDRLKFFNRIGLDMKPDYIAPANSSSLRFDQAS